MAGVVASTAAATASGQHGKPCHGSGRCQRLHLLSSQSGLLAEVYAPGSLLKICMQSTTRLPAGRSERFEYQGFHEMCHAERKQAATAVEGRYKTPIWSYGDVAWSTRISIRSRNEGS